MIDERLQAREEEVALYEAYGPLLSPKQQAIFSDYYLYDLSLGEIAENRSISRAAVADALKKASLKLARQEAAVGLLKKKTKLLAYLDQMTSAPDEKSRLAAIQEMKEYLTHGF